MRKVLLGCLAVLLSVSDICGCDSNSVDDLDDSSFGSSNNNSYTAYSDFQEIENGSDHYSCEEVYKYVSGESYLLGYFDYNTYGSHDLNKPRLKAVTIGTNGYYGLTTSDYKYALLFTIEDVSDVENGVTLSTIIEGKTEYIGFDIINGHYYVIYSEDPQILIYDESYNVFTLSLGDSTSPSIFLGTYDDYTTFGWYDYSRVIAMHRLHPYTLPVEYVNPTEIVLPEINEVCVGEKVWFKATLYPEGCYDELIWTVDSDKVTINTAGSVTGIKATDEGEYITICATSASDSSVFVTKQIIVTNASS